MYTLEILYFLNIDGKFSISSSPVIYMFGLWVETGLLRRNWHKENIQTPHRRASDLNHETFCCEATRLSTAPAKPIQIKHTRSFDFQHEATSQQKPWQVACVLMQFLNLPRTSRHICPKIRPCCAQKKHLKSHASNSIGLRSHGKY